MKKLFVLIVFSMCISVALHSQNISRGVLAGTIFGYIFGENYNVQNHPVSEFPNPFIDLQNPQSSTDIKLFKQFSVLSHLDWGDGITPFADATQSGVFAPFDLITRGEALVAICETWHFESTVSSSSPFNDVGVNDPNFGYFLKLYDLGILTTTTVNPHDILQEDELILWLYLIGNYGYSWFSLSDLTNLDYFYEPNNYSPYNMAVSRGMNQGVFNHYAKNSFSIPDRKFNLSFSHYYSSAMVELPESFFPIKPLGRGWTHTYNSYIVRENNVGQSETDYYFIVWADGTIHIYNKDENEYESVGVYDEVDEGSTNITITKKDQTNYTFTRLDDDRDIYYLTFIEDRNNNTIEIDYESAEENDTKRIQKVIAPSGKKLDFEYFNNTDLLVSIHDPINRHIDFQYEDDRLKYFYDAKDNQTRYYYLSNDFENSNIQCPDLYLLRRIELPENNNIYASYDDENNGKLASYQIQDQQPTEISLEYDYDNSMEIEAEIHVPMPTGGSQMQNYVFNEHGLVISFESDVDDVSVQYPSSGINVALPDQTNLL